MEQPTRLDGYALALVGDPNELLAAEIKDAKTYLSHLLATNTLEGIGITTDVRTGIVAQQILQCMEEHQDDLIVICSQCRQKAT